jgi:hypothetical protein
MIVVKHFLKFCEFSWQLLDFRTSRALLFRNKPERVSARSTGAKNRRYSQTCAAGAFRDTFSWKKRSLSKKEQNQPTFNAA